ncbi:MAG: hypothetical protein ACQEQF_00015 [Bacillota bacterium]
MIVKNKLKINNKPELVNAGDIFILEMEDSYGERTEIAYMLVQTGRNELKLIGLESGNRLFDEAFEYEADYFGIRSETIINKLNNQRHIIKWHYRDRNKVKIILEEV